MHGWNHGQNHGSARARCVLCPPSRVSVFTILNQTSLEHSKNGAAVRSRFLFLWQKRYQAGNSLAPTSPVPWHGIFLWFFQKLACEGCCWIFNFFLKEVLSRNHLPSAIITMHAFSLVAHGLPSSLHFNLLKIIKIVWNLFNKTLKTAQFKTYSLWRIKGLLKKLHL